MTPVAHSMESRNSILEARGLGQTLTKNNNFNTHQIYIIQVLGVTSATVSIFCSLIIIYWFLRMRRSFRHHLIMLLLFSDFWKAVWYLIFPVASFVQGPIPTASSLCQADGFMTAFGFEATDSAVLVIAVHSAICIFAGKVVRGEAGLYRYRWYAYGSWVIFASIMAGLAFTNREHAYISQGSFCYLPVRPFWYRLALSWIPRYLILATITGLYLAIYCYVRIQFKQLGDETRASYLESITEGPWTLSTSQAIKESKYTSEPGSPLHDSQNLSGTTAHESCTRKSSKRSSISEIPAWDRYSFGTSAPLPPSDIATRTEINSPGPGSVPLSESARRVSTTSSNNSSKRVSIARALRDMRINSLAPLPRPNLESTTDLIQQPHASPTAGGAAALNPVPDPLALTTLQTRHRAIKKQIRYLFIYPLVYMAVWIVPFVSHCLQYSDYFSRNPPFALQCASVSILALQCAIDCCLFAFREKPWRHIDGLPTQPVLTSDDYNRTKKGKDNRSGKFWPSLKFWDLDVQNPVSLELGILRRPKSIPGTEKVGKSKSEMAFEGRIARRRREVEELGNRESWAEIDRRRRESEDRRGGRSRQWWEAEGKHRNDSVILGIDNLHDEGAIPFYPTENAARSPTIVEEGGEDAEESDKDVVDISPRTSNEAVNAHLRELFSARKGKKPSVDQPSIPRDLNTPNAENMDLSRPRPSDAEIDWATVYDSKTWREDSVVGKPLRKTKEELGMTARGGIRDDRLPAQEGETLHNDSDGPLKEGDRPPPTLPPIPTLPKLTVTPTTGDTISRLDTQGYPIQSTVEGEGGVKPKKQKKKAEKGTRLTAPDARPPRIDARAMCRGQ